MSSSKDGTRKTSTVPKKISSTKATASKRESSTERRNTKKKEDPQKNKEKEASSSSSLTKISEDNNKSKKSSTLTKPLYKSEKPSNSKKAPTGTSLKPSSKSNLDLKKTSSRSTNEITKTSSRKTINNKKSTIKVDSSRGEVPVTPTSSRISKTQYFPSKNLYSNALKSTDVQEKLLEISKEKEDESLKKSFIKEKVKKTQSTKIKTTSLTDSPKTIKSVKTGIKEVSSSKDTSLDNPYKTGTSRYSKVRDKFEREISPDTSSTSERPRTATLRKGSIVNANIVGPDVPTRIKEVKVKESLLVPKTASVDIKKSPSPTNSDENYDDDFESYDSDFEAYSSSEETANLVNISGEETSSVSSSSENIPEKNDTSPSQLQTEVKQVSLANIDDERSHDSGTFELQDFKHQRILEHIKESVIRENAVLEEEKLKEKVNHSSLSDEGFEDQKSLQFINFADAKKKCQKRRASEARRKRGEEILGMIRLDHENFTIFDSPAVPYEVFITNYGQNNRVQTSAQTGDDDISEEVQTEVIEVQTKWTQMPIKISSFDQEQENFWINYQKEYLGVGADCLIKDIANEKLNVNEKRLTLFLKQSVDLVFEIMAESNIKNIDKLQKNKQELPFSHGYIQFNTSEDIFNNSKVQTISVFSKNINKILTVHLKKDDSLDNFVKSIVSIWNTSDFNVPETILVSYGQVYCATFSLDFSEYIFAGQKDGAILVWNIKEKSQIYSISKRTPTFITDIKSSHFSKVVSVQCIKDSQEQRGYFKSYENNELCSLDEDGNLKIWNLYTDFELKKSTSNIVLINTATIRLQDIYPEMPDLLCSDLIVLDKHIYISTNYGFILHYLISGTRENVKKFIPANTIDAKCLESCPFSPSFFLAGYSNGNITLYSRNTERPLMVLRNNEEIDSTSVQIIQWSKTKPFVLYTKDSQNSIHIWDLSKSDMYPEYSIPFKNNISCLKLSPIINVEQTETSYMLIGTEDGKVFLHLLNKEYGQESYEVYNEHVATFLNYVNRL